MANLDPQDQLTILNSHLKNLNFNAYNLQISLLEENAKTTPDANAIASINAQLADIAKQVAAIEEQVTTVTSTIPA
jgi:CII-binding regulator of phage lambda lysogenization HflD